MVREIARREELSYPYEHPYRRSIPRAWSKTHAARTGIGGLVAAAASVLATLFSGEVGWLGPGLAVMCAASAWSLWGTTSAALQIRSRTLGWDQGGTLRSVREQRPHAVDADPDLAHDEFAVTVEETGEFWVWRYRALHVDELPTGDEVLVPGRPQWAAKVVDGVSFSGADAASAAGQLAEAQQRAAALETHARTRAHALVDASAHAHEIEAETASTAAALRHLTGQRGRR